MSFDKSEGTLHFVKDGKLMPIMTITEEMKTLEFPEDILSKVYLASCALDYKGGCTGPEGEVSDFNMWDRTLTVDEMIGFTTCSNKLKGNMVNWDYSDWKVENMTVTDVDYDEICIPPRPGHVLFPEKRGFPSLTSICHQMRGLPAVIKNQETQHQMTEIASKIPECLYDERPTYWAGWTDAKEEGVWVGYEIALAHTSTNIILG